MCNQKGHSASIHAHEYVRLYRGCGLLNVRMYMSLLPLESPSLHVIKGGETIMLIEILVKDKQHQPCGVHIGRGRQVQPAGCAGGSCSAHLRICLGQWQAEVVSLSVFGCLRSTGKWRAANSQLLPCLIPVSQGGPS